MTLQYDYKTMILDSDRQNFPWSNWDGFFELTGNIAFTYEWFPEDLPFLLLIQFSLVVQLNLIQDFTWKPAWPLVGPNMQGIPTVYNKHSHRDLKNWLNNHETFRKSQNLLKIWSTSYYTIFWIKVLTSTECFKTYTGDLFPFYLQINQWSSIK